MSTVSCNIKLDGVQKANADSKQSKSLLREILSGHADGFSRNLSSNLAPFLRVPHCGADKAEPLLSDTWISLFGGDGGGRNQASRGGGP